MLKSFSSSCKSLSKINEPSREDYGKRDVAFRQAAAPHSSLRRSFIQPQCLLVFFFPIRPNSSELLVQLCYHAFGFFCPLWRKYDLISLSVHMLESITRLNRASSKTSQWCSGKRCSSAKNNSKYVNFFFTDKASSLLVQDREWQQQLIFSPPRVSRVVRVTHDACIQPVLFFPPRLEAIRSLFKYPLN